MNRITFFLSAPISGFSSEVEYSMYRAKVLSLIDYLSLHFNVYSEIREVKDKKDYDSPQQSAINDFSQIDKADLFLMLHPNRMQTSSLIELGYAYGKNKPIIIVGKTEDLPYLAIGIEAINNSAYIIDSSEIDKTIQDRIISITKKLFE